MRANASRQYTIRNIPEHVDRVLRQRARATGKSFNRVVLEALMAGTGESAAPRRDLRGIVGSISAREADELEAEFALQHHIDPTLWS